MTSSTSKDANFALVGIRLGASNIVVAYFKDGRSETVVNELGDRVTPTFVTFSEGNDISMGLPAKQNFARNQQNTVIWASHFLEKHDDNDILLTKYNQKSPISVIENENRIEFSLTIDGKTKSINLESVIIHLLNYVRQLVQAVTGSREVQAVLSVPHKMTQTVNQELIQTCMKKSGIELHSIISDACSACLAYELDKESGHVESNILVYRLGGSTYECSIIRTTGGCLQTIASVDGFENSGDDFTDLIIDIIADEFQKKNKSDPRLSQRSLLKLRACSEQAKHVLSTTPVTQCSIDALYDGIDLDSNISRLRFDGVANYLINNCLKPIDIVMDKAQLQPDDIKLIVLCGGGTKIPKLRDAIQDRLSNADMLSSITGDEVIALGAARQCYIENKYAKIQLSTDKNNYERVGSRYFRSHLIITDNQKAEISDSDGDGDEDDEKENDQIDIDWNKHESYLRKLDLGDWKNQDHYKVLGLSKLRYKATQKQVRNAHKLMILRYHPDKSKRIESERFSLITHAFELLSNPTLRRSYDSIDPKFDDSIPNPTTADNFYQLFGPVFERNARWSIHQHVPLLGNDDTSFELVNRFYRFWYDFVSWREYSFLDEEDKSQGQDRDERRYIEKMNRAERQKRKKIETTRLRNLVDRAYALDPRIKRQKKEEQQRKDDEKLRRRQEIDKRRQEQKQKEIDEANRIAEEKQRVDEEAKRKQDEVKREKDAQKKLIKKEKKQFRDLCKESNYFNDAAAAKNLKQIEQIETLIEHLSIDDLKALNEKLKEENADQSSIVLSEVRKMEEQMHQSRLESSQQSSSSSSASASNSNSKLKWTTEDIELLVKALRIYPAGVQNRWLVVQEYLKRSGGNPNRTAQDIMQKAKDIGSGKKEVAETISSLENIALNSHKQTSMLENQAKLSQLEVSERDDVTTPWSVDEQRIFEQALRTYPATLGASRWDQIAESLPSRTKKECLERYKELARMVQAKKATNKS
ncbi:unnamed protein product [Rotaria magnacalcarata]|uniref:DnaJ homolog subfamily C member 2 n=1 Tax=Rotaria magnacalcarata TaxID=392030 RepID=A0A816SYY3_9BILA|nr:unnamed protein product [Rotaria magnacalcarata]CAF2017221.1 unnamed protein product [Rotaria magnacalcarata]CAF2091129.1 unnamed protein product [Rotaria magnacalcarata]CAF3775815.1 unnamed protein product [Rotaria magnacalcarata]CAF3921795.1 unnamed protein product [Rotaria magnacalcarata]